MLSLQFSDKVTIVTGGGRGIGRSIALRFAEAGSDIVIFDVLKQEAADTINCVISRGKKGTFYQVDVTKESEVSEAVKKVLDEYRKIDFLVNNAGITSRFSFTELPTQIWQKTLSVNLTGAFFCCKAIVPAMINQKSGRIVLISSGSAITGSGGGAHYASSKGGVNSLVRALSRELASYNILVNGVAPRNIKTGTLGDIHTEEQLKNLTKRISLKRLGTPEEVANVVLFLCSSLSAYITGQIILVDGGRTFTSN
jgi:3-oxoacyl-[acyl-carrier protein] reductase